MELKELVEKKREVEAEIHRLLSDFIKATESRAYIGEISLLYGTSITRKTLIAVTADVKIDEVFTK